jgi:hypothetical protein
MTYRGRNKTLSRLFVGKSKADMARPNVPLGDAFLTQLQPPTPTTMLDSPVLHPQTLPAMGYRSEHFWRQNTRMSLAATFTSAAAARRLYDPACESIRIGKCGRTRARTLQYPLLMSEWRGNPTRQHLWLQSLTPRNHRHNHKNHSHPG